MLTFFSYSFQGEEARGKGAKATRIYADEASSVKKWQRVMPIAQLESAQFIMLSTINNDPNNAFTKLVQSENAPIKIIFKDVVCPSCRALGIETCDHVETPHWLNKNASSVIMKISEMMGIGKEMRPELMNTTSSTKWTQVFNEKIVRTMFNTFVMNQRNLRNKEQIVSGTKVYSPGVVVADRENAEILNSEFFTTVDPAAGGSSYTAIVSCVIFVLKSDPKRYKRVAIIGADRVSYEGYQGMEKRVEALFDHIVRAREVLGERDLRCILNVEANFAGESGFLYYNMLRTMQYDRQQDLNVWVVEEIRKNAWQAGVWTLDSRKLAMKNTMVNRIQRALLSFHIDFFTTEHSDIDVSVLKSCNYERRIAMAMLLTSEICDFREWKEYNKKTNKIKYHLSGKFEGQSACDDMVMSLMLTWDVYVLLDGPLFNKRIRLERLLCGVN